MSRLDPQRLLELCASLHDQNLVNLQIKINKFVSEMFSSVDLFVLLLSCVLLTSSAGMQARTPLDSQKI
jgi:hypothetical protein